MDTLIERKAHLFRFPTTLLEKLKELAHNDRRSLNNYVEGLLLDAIYNQPNNETQQAINDAKAGKYEGVLDVSSGESMLKSMGL